MTDHLDWYPGRSILVTGGLGFIGSNLALALDALGARVTIVDSSIPGLGANRFNVDGLSTRAQVADIDLRDSVALAPLLAGQDCVFNLAGQVSHIDSMVDPLTDLDLNGRAQLSLLEAIRSSGERPRVVFASTRQVYGRPDQIPVAEDHPVRPTDINGVHKQAAEHYHRLYHEVHGVPTVVLRLANVYGPRQLMRGRSQGFIPIFVRAAIEDGTIELFGGGHQERDANYIDDVVDAFLRCGPPTGAAPGSTYNLGSEPPFTLQSFAKTLVAIAGAGTLVDAAWPADRARIDVGSVSTDSSRIAADLGWTPSWSLSDGLEATVAYYRLHGRHYW